MNKILKLASLFEERYLNKYANLKDELTLKDMNEFEIYIFREYVRTYQGAHSLYPLADEKGPYEKEKSEHISDAANIQDPYNNYKMKYKPNDIEYGFRYAINQLKIHMNAFNATDKCIFNHLVKLNKIDLLSDPNYSAKKPFIRTIDREKYKQNEDKKGYTKPIPVNCK